MRNQRIQRGLAIIMMAGGLIAAPSPASAATLAGTKQVWQGGDWRVEATPYWCRAYPAAAEKNADGIPAVALIQWDGKVYLELERQAHTDSESVKVQVSVEIGGSSWGFPMKQKNGHSWITLNLTDGSMDELFLKKIREGADFTVSQPRYVEKHYNQPLTVTSAYGKPKTYSLRGSTNALIALDKCSKKLVDIGTNRLAPMARERPNRKLEPKGNPSNWVPMSAYPRTAYSTQVRSSVARICKPLKFDELKPCTPSAIEGTVGFKLSVGADGRPNSCKVTSSSGNADLDAATCSNAMKRAKFIAETNAYGYPVPSEYSGRVRWEFPRDSVSSEPLSAFPIVSFDDKSRPPIPKSKQGNWVPQSPYPRGPEMNIEGTVGFTLTVGPDGRPTNCKITSSSGNYELDAITCPNLMRRAKFDAALDYEGKPIVGEYSSRVRWEIPK